MMAALLALCAMPSLAQPVAGKDELAYRVALGRADDIKLLLSKGANPNGVNAEGLPLLLVAASRKDGEALGAVQALLEGGADVNTKDKQGQTALYYASRAGKPGVVEHLLKNRIDYYSLDNNGDIARTIAFRAGHDDIVKLMDAYVKSQTILAQNTYENAQRQVKEQQEKEAREGRIRALEAAQQAAAIEAKQLAERQKQLKQYQENLKTLDTKVYEMSYHACVFQYWSFALAANQTMEISDEEAEELIALNREDAKRASLEVMKMFGVGQPYVNRVLVPSKQAIFDQLNQMPSRTYRKENGVGTLADVHKRCQRIAKNWEVSIPTANAQAAAQQQAIIAQQKALEQRVAQQKAQQAKLFPGRQMMQKTGAAAVPAKR